MSLHTDLIETLRQAQRFGFFGARPIEEAVEHSMAFVRALDDLPAGTRVVDIGSGGGLPGLLLGAELPECSITLVDRRQKRTDFLERAVRRLGWDHVAVVAADVDQVIRDITHGELARFDAVTARGFGPPDLTLRFARALVADHGRVVISEPPTGDRWPSTLLDELGLGVTRHGAVAMFHVKH